MSIGFMITNGGPHPPEKWADMTAKEIAGLIVIEPSAPTQAIIDKREFETALFKLLVGLHTDVQGVARTHLRQKNSVDHGTLAHAHAYDAAGRIAQLAAGTRFADHFDKPEVRTFLRNVTGQHFANSIHIERSWHADRNRKS